MERNSELFDALYLLRQQIREREKARTGRTPTVCPDDALREMVRLMPQKASDFYSIGGVGPAFVENFANEFLAEYERGTIVERTQTGKAVARQDPNFRDGRPKKFTPEQIDLALSLLEQGKTYRQITAMTGISKSTLIRAKNQGA